MSDLELSTMTLDGQLSNVRFDKKDAINGLYTYQNIIKIGCNYGSYVDTEAMSYFNKDKPKTNRGRKPKRVESTRKKQGTGSHFNSQITFSITNNNKEYLYQVKLFTNGRIQIPGIGHAIDDYLKDDIISSIIQTLIDYINHNKTLKFKEDDPIYLTYLSPILQNYKFILPVIPNVEFLDLNILQHRFNLIRDSKSFQLNIHSIIFHPERYAGLLVKFSTPELVTDSYKLNKLIEIVRLYKFKMNALEKTKFILDVVEPDSDADATTIKMVTLVNKLKTYWMDNNKIRKKFKAKRTTVKIFKSGKINIDSANSKEEGDNIRRFLIQEFEKNRQDIIYTMPDDD